MRKRKDKQADISATTSAEQVAPPDTTNASTAIETTPAQPSADAPSASEAAIDCSMAICPQIADAPSIAPPSDEVLKAEIAKVMSASEEPAPAESVPADNITPITHALFRPDKIIDAQAAPRRSRFRQLRMRHMTRLAATVAIAAAVGAIAGSLSTIAVGGLASSSGDSHTSISDLTRIDQELATLKSGFETSRKTAGTQLARVVERLDRAERAQSEPATKLSKLTEAVDRLERRSAAPATTAASLGAPLAISAPATTAANTTTSNTTASNSSAGNAAAASDITGSIPTPRSAPQGETNALPKPAVVEGWTLRNVYDGIALVQGRFGLIEVEPGDVIPGVGRIDTIRRQDGRWVVVTSKGLIVAR